MKEHRDRDRWRGGGSTRIETLTDAVFGFSITLLVVSLEVPDTFDDLLVTLRGFLAFAASFALLILVWWYHYRLFDRFHLEDGFTVFLNSMLLFVVLFYVYPLKFVFTVWLGPADGPIFSSSSQLQLMMTVYGLGFVAVFAVFALLYRHALATRERLDLTELEVLKARERVAECLVMVGVGVLSIGVAQVLPSRWAPPVAGSTYFLIGPAQYARGRYHGRRIEEALASGTGSGEAADDTVPADDDLHDVGT